MATLGNYMLGKRLSFSNKRIVVSTCVCFPILFGPSRDLLRYLKPIQKSWILYFRDLFLYLINILWPPKGVKAYTPFMIAEYVKAGNYSTLEASCPGVALAGNTPSN